MIQAYGIDGTVGYIKASDLSSNVSTPEEALTEQNTKQSPRLIPLYAIDGITIIGSFEVG